MARPRRFERPTPTLGGWCSIQLSYERIFTLKILAFSVVPLNNTPFHFQYEFENQLGSFFIYIRDSFSSPSLLTYAKRVQPYFS